MASRLPIEVVTHVMTFLGMSDRKEAALVCRKWYEASLDPVLQRNVLLNFTYEKTDEILKTFCRRRLTHLVLSHFDNSSITRNAILKACELGSENLKSLSLKHSNITEGTLVELLSRCSQLTSLDLSGCNSLFMAGTLLNNQGKVGKLQETMKNVLELNLSYLRYISDCSFNRLMTVFPGLEKIALASTHITFNGQAYYNSQNEVFDNSAVFTFNCIEKYLQNNVSRIKGLNFSRTTINNQHLARLVRIADLQLEELTLIGCRDVGNEGISQLCRHQPGLKRLDVSGCLDLTDAGFRHIASHLTGLHMLRANKCRMITDNSVASLKSLRNLQMLDLSECYEVTSTGLSRSLCGEDGGMRRLRELNLSCCSKLDTVLIVQLTQSLPLLQHLDLGSCFLLQDVGLHTISSALHGLRYLRLAWCKALTDLGLLGLKVNGMCPLHDPVTSIMEGECSCTHKSHTPVIFRKPTEALREKKEAQLRKMMSELEETVIPENISALVNLRCLDLSACHQFTDLGLRGAVKFNELRVLKLNCIHALTEAGLIDIAVNNPGLEELQMQQCARITDASIDVVTSRCQRLSHLDVSNCDRLTDTALIHMGDNCKRLHHLDISFCCGLSPQAADMLESRLTSLLTFHRRNIGLSNLTQALTL